MQVIDAQPSGTDLTLRLSLADTWPLRLRGLLGRPAPGAQEGMLITRCRNIHTVGMAYPIDVLFLDRDGRIVRIVTRVRPRRWRVAAPWRSGAVNTLEMAAGEAARLGLWAGQRLRLHRPLTH